MCTDAYTYGMKSSKKEVSYNIQLMAIYLYIYTYEWIPPDDHFYKIKGKMNKHMCTDAFAKLPLITLSLVSYFWTLYIYGPDESNVNTLTNLLIRSLFNISISSGVNFPRTYFETDSLSFPPPG